MKDQLIHFFISNAHAADSLPPAPQNGGFSFMLFFAIAFIFIYFSVWRPQNKRTKEQKKLLNSIVKGDEVLTAGGFLGKITKISDQYVILTISNAVEITMQKSAVVNVLPKGTIKSLE